jgi:hypothetical protein
VKKLTIKGQVALAIFQGLKDRHCVSTEYGGHVIHTAIEDLDHCLGLADWFLNNEGVTENAADADTFSNIAASLLRSMDKSSEKTEEEMKRLDAMIERGLSGLEVGPDSVY